MLPLSQFSQYHIKISSHGGFTECGNFICLMNTTEPRLDAFMFSFALQPSKQAVHKFKHDLILPSFP